ncbi:MAG TPA: MFS transporter [Gaiellaceae bacterium]|nr:MFS transporter [Gaiellaceae bacterium]
MTFAVLALGGISYALLQSLVAPALPALQHDLHTSEDGVSWVLTAYLLSASIATPLLGRLGDMHGKERMLVLALALLAVGTLTSALATSLALMLVGRVVQGAAGGIFPLAFGIIRDEFPRPRVAGAIGLMSALLGVGGGAGVVLAGPIVDNFSIHSLFWLPLVPIVLATILTYLLVPESPVKAPGGVNWLGATLLSLGLVAVLVGVSETTSWGWLSPKTLGSIAAGVVLLVLWVMSDARSAHPLVDMQMMRIRGVWTTNTAALLLGFGMYSSFILLPEVVETPSRVGYGFGASVTAAGLFMLPSTIAMLLVGSQTGRLEERFGSKPLLVGGTALTAVAFGMLALARTESWEIYLASAILGAGIGLAFASMANLIIENVGPAETGVATGMNTVTRTVGGAFGGAATASIVAGTIGAGGYPSAHGYTLAFLLCLGALVAGALASLGVPQRRPEAAFEPHPAGDVVEQAA